MADDTERLILQMSADLRRFEREMARSRTIADRRLNDVERRARQADKNLSRIMGDAGRNMVGSLRQSLGSLAPTLAAAFSTAQVIKYADSYTNLQNRLRAVGLEGERLKGIEDALFEAANRNGIEVDAVAQLYQRASLARGQLAASDEQLIALTNGVTAALRVQGVTAQQASGPLLQLGQALGAGTVRAEELNSLLEGTPVLLQAAANGSQRFGGDVSKLSAAIREGEVSSRDFFAALLNGLPALEQQAAKMPLTVGGAFQVLDNELGKFIGRTDEGLSASERLAQGIEGLARNLDTVVLMVGAVAALMGGRFLLALTASTSAMVANGIAAVRLAAFQTAMTASMTGTTTATVVATGAMRTFNGVLLANPIGAVVIAVTALSAAIVFLGDKMRVTGQESRALQASKDALTTATKAYEDAANAAAVATGEEAKVAREAAARKRELAVAARQAAAAKLAEAAATVAVMEAEIGRRLNYERFNIRGDRPGSVNLVSREERQQLENARTDAKAARDAITEANRTIASADAAMARAASASAAPAAPSGPRGGSRASGPTGPTPEELARMREQLALQQALALAQAKGDTIAATQAQRRLDIISLTEQLERAQIANAEALATQQVDAVLRAETAAKAREEGERRVLAVIEAVNEAADIRTEIELDQLRLAADLAQLRGDPKAIQRAERELFIETEVNRLLAQRKGLITEVEARRQATAEADAREAAGAAGEVRREIEYGLRDGLRSLVEGDLKGMFQSLADSFTDRILDNLAADLADILMNALKGQGASGNWLATAFSAIGSSFGFKAPAPAAAVPVPTAGTALPALNSAMGMVQGTAKASAQPTIVRLVVDEGSMFAPRVQQISGPIAVEMASATSRHDHKSIPTQMAKSGRYRLR